MNQPNLRPPWISLIVLLLVGTGAIAFAFWLLDHRQTMPNAGTVIAVLVVVFFVAYTWGFLRYLHWRDKHRATIITMPSQSNPADLEGTVYGLVPEREYQVIKSFTDHYGNSFEQGERLHFKQRHFLPYHGGHTIVFEERSLYLQEDQNREILDHFSDYIVPIQP